MYCFIEILISIRERFILYYVWFFHWIGKDDVYLAVIIDYFFVVKSLVFQSLPMFCTKIKRICYLKLGASELA